VGRGAAPRPVPLVACVVVAAGSGTRLGAGPKAFVLLGGLPLLGHAALGVAAACDDSGEPAVDLLVVVAPPGSLSAARNALAGRWPVDRDLVVVAGGSDRVESVQAGLAALPAPVQVVLVHDAARCLTPPGTIASIVATVRSGHDAVAPGVAVVDTVKLVDESTGPPWTVQGTPQRTALRAIQTPQGFRREVLESAHEALRRSDLAIAVTDDAGAVEAMGGTVTIIPGHAEAFKITTVEDLRAAEWVLASRASRTTGEDPTMRNGR